MRKRFLLHRYAFSCTFACVTKLQCHRLKAKKSVLAVAVEAGVTPKTVQNWEALISEPSLSQGVKIADFLGVPEARELVGVVPPGTELPSRLSTRRPRARERLASLG